MRLGGFYAWVTRRIAALPLAPAALLGVTMAASAALSAVFSNDVVCLSMAPVLADACLRRRLDPVPFLLGLACAANIGSAATLIGNPQNMLIGEVLSLSFAGYLGYAFVPVSVGLVFLAARGGGPRRRRAPDDEPAPALEQDARPRGLGAAHPLHRAFRREPRARPDGPLSEPVPLFASAFVLSNVVSNVPAVMLLLPAATQPFSGPMLALVSTLAGNLLIVGSIANIIVVDAARRRGIAISWLRHARTGVPVTVTTLAVTAAWFWLQG